MLSTSLRHLEYACAIARAGGLTAAAGMLHVSQPALTVALAQLERALGQTLFHRRPGGPMVPTAFGRLWLAQAEAELAAIARLMSGQFGPAPLRLAIFEELAPLVLAQLLIEAGNSVAPRIMGFEPLTRDLQEGQADMALTWDLGLAPEMERLTLRRLPPRAILSEGHELAGRSSLALADLAGEPLVLTDQGLSIAHMRALFARAGLEARIAHRCATLDLMRSFAANGLGVGLSYAYPAPSQSPDGKPLITLPVHDAGTEPLVLVRPAGGMDRQRAEDLFQLLSRVLP